VAVFLACFLVAGIAAYASVTVISILKKRMERDGETSLPAAESDAIRGRLEAAEALEVRVAELDERLDFAERLLAQHHEPERLPTGQTLDSQH